MDIQAKVGLRSLKQLERRLELNPTKFLCGSSLSIADLCVYGDVGQLAPRFGLGQRHLKGLFGPGALDFGKLPRVKGWMDQMEKVSEFDVIHHEYESFISKL